ncbi:hypothetical protein MW887_000816 [Aspergillus wentii]|nr:hypothetical protein MW887_000816 [Aspergillus wentii]
MSPTLKNHISAIVFYGDPCHMPNQTYNMGNGTRSAEGQKQRAFLNEHYSDLIADYCNPNDPVCASGDDITAHMEYVYLWNDNAAAFFKRKVTETLKLGSGLKGIQSEFI